MKFRLKKLSLDGLPQLEHVWDKDPEGIIDFSSLQDLSISKCNSLKYVFPAWLTKDLVKLKKLKVAACEQLTEIFIVDKINSKAVSISFEFRSLKEVHITECKWVMIKWQEGEAYIEQVLVSDYQKVNLSVQNLDRFSCDIGNAVVTWELESKELKLSDCQHFQKQSDNIAYQVLQLVPNVEKLELRDSSLKEMFSAERPKADCAGVISHPKELMISNLSNLKSIGLEHSWIHPIPENLQTLVVQRCPLIKNLASGMVALSNLTDLVISACDNMLHLFTCSTAKSLAQLKTMRISSCRSMQEIVSEEGDESDHECEDIIFKQLQDLNLEDLPKLTCFYPGRYTLCFPSLEQVSLTKCLMMKTFCAHIKIKEDSNHRLDGLIKSTPWEGDIDTTIRKMNVAKIAEYARKLQALCLGDKPHFQEMWLGSMPVPDTCFGHLTSLIVNGCEFLSEVLPYHLLPFFSKMESLEVRNCSSVKTIFGVKCITNVKEITIRSALLPFLFSLKILVLMNLPNLESVWNEGLEEIDDGIESAHDGINLNFPCLASLTLLDLPNLKCFLCSLHCEQLKRFGGLDANIEDQACVKEVIPNMSKLSLGEIELKMICHGHEGISLHKVKVLNLQSFNVDSDEFPYGFLQKVPDIEELVVHNSSRLTKLVPPPVCFSGLVCLSVHKCNEMVHLFTSSTAKSLAHLKKMNIYSCKSMKEIVSNEGDESHHDHEIVFEQLQQLTLHDLPNLESFYNGNFTLRFPSLDQLRVIDCCRMDKFCVGTINANKLSAIDLDWGSTPLDVDLNSTVHKAFKDQLARFAKEVKDLKLVDKPEVHEIWNGSFSLSNLCFFSLKSLIVERCEFLSTAIPSRTLGLLPMLEELEVRQCQEVKTIFEVKEIVKGKKKLNEGPAFSPPFRLKKMTFENLPNLENVWDSDTKEVIGLQNLQEMYVNGCGRLERLFPESVAKSLVKLEKLEVQECGRLVEIVAENKAVAEGAPKEFVMPCMTSIKLWSLPELKYFYPGPHTLKCPKLKQVNLFHCDKLKIIPEAQPEYEVGIPQALFLAEKVIPYLEFLAMSKEMAMLIRHGQLDGNLLHKLQALQLQCFHDDSDTFPYELLQKVPYMEKLGVICSSFKEIFCSERPNADCGEIFSNLKCLQLSSLSKLKVIGFEHSWVDPISDSLETLQIDQCHSLSNIVACKVSFSSLTDLNVSQCNGLVYLFTPSTSRTLCQLKNMSIEKCESLEEIVSGEAEEEEEDIIFHTLETLSLHSLPKLERFYSGSGALRFPSMDILSVINCSKMESFCANAVSVNANRWTEFKFKENKRAIPLKMGLNSAIRKAFEGTLYY